MSQCGVVRCVSSPNVYIDKVFPHQPPENEGGNREYKLKLYNYSKIHRIASQLRYRLYEGDGKALYFLGVTDDGKSFGSNIEDINKSIEYLVQACTNLEKESGEVININKIRIYQGFRQRCYIATVRVSTPNFKEC